MSLSGRPIGIFDSGIGGLTVLKEIGAVTPEEDTVYLGDTARVPYGIRSAETVTRYAFENTRFLISQDIKMLVIACNTASAVSLSKIRESFDLPVIGVIEPGAKAAAGTTRTGRVGVIGTEATVRSGAYSEAIRACDPKIEVVGLPCPLFVPLVEEGWTGGKITGMIVAEYLSPLKEKGIDTLVLGCTHYPLLKGVIGDFLGHNVTLIDSAIETAREIKSVLAARSLEIGGGGGARTYFVTDSPERFRRVGEFFLKEEIHTIEKIEIGMEV